MGYKLVLIPNDYPADMDKWVVIADNKESVEYVLGRQFLKRILQDNKKTWEGNL